MVALVWERQREGYRGRQEGPQAEEQRSGGGREKGREKGEIGKEDKKKGEQKLKIPKEIKLETRNKKEEREREEQNWEEEEINNGGTRSEFVYKSLHSQDPTYFTYQYISNLGIFPSWYLKIYLR